MTDESVRSLLLAARSSDLAAIEWLVRRDPSIHIGSDYEGKTALHTAASYGNCDAVRLLLDLGASVRVRMHKSASQNTPFSLTRVQLMALQR